MIIFCLKIGLSIEPERYIRIFSRPSFSGTMQLFPNLFLSKHPRLLETKRFTSIEDTSLQGFSTKRHFPKEKIRFFIEKVFFFTGGKCCFQVLSSMKGIVTHFKNLQVRVSVIFCKHEKFPNLCEAPTHVLLLLRPRHGKFELTSMPSGSWNN